MSEKRFTLSILVQALDRLTAPVRKMAGAFGQLTRAGRDAERAADGADRAGRLVRAAAGIRRVADRLERLTAPLRKVERGFSRIGKQLARLGRAAGFDRLAASIGKIKERVGGLLASFAKLGAAGAAVGAGLLYAFKRFFVDVGAQFEDFRVTLDTVMGGEAAGGKAMAWIEQFTAKTPYELAEVTQAFIKAKNYGIDPMSDALRIMGDTAAGNIGKTMDDVVEAVADAQLGENERLKEFGIKASKVGKQFAYEFDLNGKTMRIKADANNREMIRSTILAIWNQKYKGLMDKKSKTWNSMVSNLADAWSSFAKKIMNSGPFQLLKGRLQGILDQIERMGMTGELDALAESIGGKLTVGLEKAWEAGTQIWDLLQRLGRAADWLQDKLGGWDNLCIALAVVLAGPLLASLVSVTTAVWSLGAALLATPVGWILLAIAAVVALAVAIYKNWDDIVATLSGWWDDVKARWAEGMAFLGGVIDGIAQAFGGLGEAASRVWDGLVAALAAMPGKVGAAAGRIWSSMTAGLSGLWDGLSGAAGKIGGALSSMAGVLAAMGRSMIASWWDATSAAWSAGLSWLAGLGTAIVEPFRSIDLGGAAGEILTGFWGAFRAAWSAGLAGMAGLGTAILRYFTGIDLDGPAGDMLRGFWEAFRSAWSAGLSWLAGIGASIVEPFRSIDLGGAAGEILSGFWDAFRAAWSAGLAGMAEIGNAIAEPFASVSLYDVGAGIMRGLWDGLQSVWSQMGGWFGGVADKISSFASNVTPDFLKSEAKPGEMSSGSGQTAPAASTGAAPASPSTGAASPQAPQSTGAGQAMRPSTGAASVLQAASAPAHSQPPQEQKVVTEVRIKADNLPQGMSVSAPRSQADRTSIDQGFSMQGAG